MIEEESERRDKRVWLSGLAAGSFIDVLDSAINGAVFVVWAIAHGPIFAEAIAGIMPGSLVLATGALELVTWAAAGWLAAWIQSRATSAARLPAT